MANDNLGKISLSTILTAMNGRKDLVEEIVSLFLQQAPQDLLAITEALNKGESEEIIRTTHHMKSTVSIFGASNLSQILHEMEELGKSGKDLGKIKLLNLELKKECGEAIEEIKSKIKC